jgi:hypothetical protein
MVLAIHSDTSYLNEPKARSRVGGHHFLSTNDEIPANNGAVLNISQIIKAVMSSAAESELGALFINAKQALPQRTTLEEMGHPQPPTPIQTDNLTAYGVVNHKNPAQSNESHGYAFPLASRPGESKTIPNLLETRADQQGRLLDKAPCRTTSSKFQTGNFVIKNCFGSTQTRSSKATARRRQRTDGKGVLEP